MAYKLMLDLRLDLDPRMAGAQVEPVDEEQGCSRDGHTCGWLAYRNTALAGRQQRTQKWWKALRRPESTHE
jgi:hypothetical protein